MNHKSLISRIIINQRSPNVDPVEFNKTIADSGHRRYRIGTYSFDLRVTSFINDQEIFDADPSNEDAINRRNNNIELLKKEFGSVDIERKMSDFIDVGVNPLSIVSYHTLLFHQIRLAFVSGGYYSALTSACALGERILNHLILDLRDSYKRTTSYAKVHGKKSFDDWSKSIDTLDSWGVLLPEVVKKFQELHRRRRLAIHFNPILDNTLRKDALSAIHLIRDIIGEQFSAFGPEPWFIPTLGVVFIKKDYEKCPFIKKYYLPLCIFVGVQHSFHTDETGVQRPVDHADYGDGSISDEEFRNAYNNRSA